MKELFVFALGIIGVMLVTCLVVGSLAVVVSYGYWGAGYSVTMPNMSDLQCVYATTDVRDINFIMKKSTSCDSEFVYIYRVTWKTDAKEWFLEHLINAGIEPIKIEPYDGTPLDDNQ